MKTTPLNCFACALAGALSVSSLPAQSAPAARPTAAQLARYDKNQNGVLEPAELALLRGTTEDSRS